MAGPGPPMQPAWAPPDMYSHSRNAFQTHPHQPDPAASYGGVPLRKSPTRPGAKLSRSDLVFPFMLVVCAIVFLLTVVLFNYGSYNHPGVVALLMIIAFGGCATMVARRQQSLIFLPMGVCAGVSLLFGAVAGTYCYDAHGYFTQLYTNARTYANVLPAEPAAAVTDAGRIAFASEAHLDLSKSASFAATDGHRYCVAPIRGLADEGKINFWAVGVDCCPLDGTFTCDDAISSQGSAGAVVFDNEGMFTSSTRSRYDVARRKAAALHHFDLSVQPLYVRWLSLEHLQGVPAQYNGSALTFMFVATAIYTALLSPLARIMCAPMMRRAELI